MHDGQNTLTGTAGGSSAGATRPSGSTLQGQDLPAPPVTEKATRTARPKARRTHTPIYDPLLGILGAAISTAAAGLIWWVGAILTLTFLEVRLGIPVARLGPWQWLIPLGITGIEIAFWPRPGQSGHLRVLFLVVAGADVLTSLDGGRAWLEARDLAPGWLTWLLGGGAAFVCAFWPERLIRSAAAHFWDNGKLFVRDLRLGLEVWRVYTDGGQSGTNDQRDAFQRMVEDLKKQRVRERITTVIIHKLDRFMRELRLTLNFEHDLKRMKIRLMSVINTIDTNTPEGRLQFQIEAGLAEYYSNNLSREVKKGLTEKARQGQWVGPTPLGYTRGPDGVLVPSPEADVIRQLFTLYASGQHSYTSIADTINAQGHRVIDRSTQVPRLFGRETVRTILRSRAYLGYVQSGGVEYPGRHAPLITQAQWDTCTGLREERDRKGGRSSVSGPRYGGILTEIVYCEACGGRMWYHHSGYGAWCYYVCSGRSRRQCAVGFVRSTLLEERALNLVRALSLPEHLHARALAMVQARQAAQEPAVKSVDKAGIEAALRRYALIFADGLISEEEYTKKKQYLLAQLQTAVETPTPRPAVNLERAAVALANLSTLLDAASTDERRALLRTLFAALYIEDGAIKAITPTVIYLPLIGAMRELMQSPEYGVADGARTRNILFHREALHH